MSDRSNSLLAAAISAFFIGLSLQPAIAQQDCTEAQATSSNPNDDPDRTDSYVCADSATPDQTIAQGDLPPFTGTSSPRAYGGSIIGGSGISLTNTATMDNENVLSSGNFLLGGILILNSENFSFTNATGASINVPDLIGILVENSSGTITLEGFATLNAGQGVVVRGSDTLTVNNGTALTSSGVGMSFEDVAALTIANTQGDGIEISSSDDAAIVVSNTEESAVNTTAIINNDAVISGGTDAVRASDFARLTINNSATGVITADGGQAVDLSRRAGSSLASEFALNNTGAITGSDNAIRVVDIQDTNISNQAAATITGVAGAAVNASVSGGSVMANVVVGNADTGIITGNAAAIQLNNITNAFVNNAGSLTTTAAAMGSAIVANTGGENAPVASLILNNEATGSINGDLNALQVSGLSQLTINNAGSLSGMNGVAIDANASIIDINNNGTDVNTVNIDGLALVADQVNIDNTENGNISGSTIDLNIGSSVANISNAGTMAELTISGLLDDLEPQRMATASVTNQSSGNLSESLTMRNLLSASFINNNVLASTTVTPALVFSDSAQVIVSNNSTASISSDADAVDVDDVNLFSVSNSGAINSSNVVGS